MIQYPVHFRVKGQAQAGVASSWTTESVSHDVKIEVAIPKEFDGPGKAFSPEDLYAMALQNCFLATFKVMAERAKLAYESIAAEVQLKVDRNEAGHPWMSGAAFVITLSGVQDEARAQQLLKTTRANCFILNSVRTELALEFKIN